MIDLAAIEEQLDEIKAKIADPMPTAPVGTVVVWYKRADVKPGAEIAAIVTKVESAGKLVLATLEPFGIIEHKRGVLHASSPIHQNRQQAVSQGSGCWDYVSGARPPKSHYDLHLSNLKVLKDSVESKLAEAKQILAKENLVAAGDKAAK